MREFDFTKCITTTKGVPIATHANSIEKFPDLFYDISVSLQQMGYERHARICAMLGQDFEDELEFLDNMPRIVKIV